MKILTLPNCGGGVSYYRHHLPMLALREAGHEVIANHECVDTWSAHLGKYPHGHEGWLRDRLDESVDLIHAGWSNSLPMLELLVAAREKYKVPVIIDYDDDVLSVDASNLNYRHYHGGAFSRRVARLGARVADSVTVSTGPLAKALAKDSRHVDMLPNYTHPPHWQSHPIDPERANDKSVRIMFAGGPSHAADIDQPHVREALEWAIAHYDGKDGRPHVKVIFLACMPKWASKFIQDCHDATANRCFFIQATGDDVHLWHKVIKWVSPNVLLAPLEHTPFNASKSLCKAYDAAMVEGCAFVCEAWPAYDEVLSTACIRVDSSSNDYNVGWKSALKVAIETPDMRRFLSDELHQWTLDKRTITAHIKQWESAYEQAAERPLVRQLSDVVRPPHLYGPDGQLLMD